jgi:hypothetical protein
MKVSFAICSLSGRIVGWVWRVGEPIYGVWDAAVGSSLNWSTPLVREQKPDVADHIFIFERQFKQ